MNFRRSLAWLFLPPFHSFQELDATSDFVQAGHAVAKTFRISLFDLAKPRIHPLQTAKSACLPHTHTHPSNLPLTGIPHAMASNTHQQQSLNDRLLFRNGDIETVLSPECALIILTATLSTPSTFLLHHFLHQVLRTSAEHSEGAVYLSFLIGKNGLYSSMKRLVRTLLSLTNFPGSRFGAMHTAKSLCICRWIFETFPA
jgi:hypothetical protein